MRKVPGINIQFPISRLILNGEKTIETRTYPLPDHMKGLDLAFIETPGNEGNFQARVIGLIRFNESFLYASKEAFYKDSSRHFVTAESKYAWDKTPKWGWVIEHVEAFSNPLPAPAKRGIKFTREVEI